MRHGAVFGIIKAAILTEYAQSIEEGLDIAQYQDLFSVVSRLPKGETKKKLGDVLFDIVVNAEQRKDCNGATVGSVLGMAFGSAVIDKEWSVPHRRYPAYLHLRCRDR